MSLSAMSLSGPVHTNGDLYLYSNSATLTVTGQVTSAGNLWRGRKNGAAGSSGRVNTYRGSFVSLGVPQHANGQWSTQSYGAPNRDWNYDTSFNNAANLPPITPRFVYLKQELFVRDFDG